MKEESTSDLNKTVTTSLFDAFDFLRSPKDDTKVLGGMKILSQLQNKNERDLEYTLKRLIRSLGANTPELRIGYFATLVNILTKFNSINITKILDIVKKELHTSGASKSEIGDVSLGQILVCGAIFRSDLMLTCSEEEAKAVIQVFLTASNKKSYLSTVSYLILIDFINRLDEDQFSSIVWANIKQEFKKDIKEHNLDSLYFLLVVSKKFPAKVKIRKLIGAAEILCEDNINDICEKLMAGIDFNSVSHPIYKEIGLQIAESEHLLLLWTGIDNQLIKHNRNRELVAINILTTVLLNIKNNTTVVPELISQNFFRLFMDWFKGLQTASKMRNKREDEDDHKIMIKKGKELLNALAKALKGDNVTSKTRLESLKKLLFNPGEINFTEITGTTVVKSVVADLDVSEIKKLAKLLKGVLLNTSMKTLKASERIWYNNERTKAAELISLLVSHEAVKDDTEFKMIYMKLLMCFGFFKIGGTENVSISSELSGAIKTCFYRCFTAKFSNVDNLVTVLSSLNSFIVSILDKEEVRIKLEKQFPTENMECMKMLTEICHNIEKVETPSKVDKVFLVLLYQLGLFLFSEPAHVKIATSSIKELKSCYAHYIKGIKKKNMSPSNDEPEWIEVLVEVLLSILSIESSVLRSVVQCVFRLLWEYITPSSIGQIMSVLDPESEANLLTNESESEEDKDDEENENSRSDQESDNDENEESDKMDNKNNEESDLSDSSLEEDDDEENMKTPDQLRIAVQKALGASADTDTESIDADMIDEEEGKKLDEALAEAFRQFHQGKNKKSKKERKNKKALSDFRIRVLDLVDIYLEKDPAMDICLGMIAPLTSCLENCIQDSQFAELENRLRKTIKNLTKVRKFASDDNYSVTIDMLCDYLNATIAKGNRSHFMYQALGDVITHFTTFIIYCSQKISKETKIKKSSPFLQVFKDALERFFSTRNCMLPIIFFHKILQTDWEGNLHLMPLIIENVFNKNVRQYRRNEGLELMVGFYRTLNRFKPSTQNAIERLQKIESKLEDSIKNTLGVQTELEIKANFITTLRKLLNVIKAFHEGCDIETNLQFEQLLSILQSVKSTVKAKNKKPLNVEKEPNNKNKIKKKKNKRKLLPQPNGNDISQIEMSAKKPRFNSSDVDKNKIEN